MFQSESLYSNIKNLLVRQSLNNDRFRVLHIQLQMEHLRERPHGMNIGNLGNLGWSTLVNSINVALTYLVIIYQSTPDNNKNMDQFHNQTINGNFSQLGYQ